MAPVETLHLTQAGVSLTWEDLQAEINSDFQYILFQLTERKVRCISKGMSHDEMVENLMTKVRAKPDKYRNTSFISMWYEFIVPNDRYTFGDFLVHIRHYNIDADLNFKTDETEIHKFVWFTKKYLLKKGWHIKEYLTNIAEVVNKGKVNFYHLGMPDYPSIEPIIH